VRISATYSPFVMFAPTDDSHIQPRVFIGPQRYVQGPAVLSSLGRYLSLVPAERVALLMSERGLRTDGVRILESLGRADVDHVSRIFRGESSLEEIDAHAEALKDARIDCLVAAGGGKCIDAGKAIAFRLGVPVVVAPTLASNDAPCSALSVIYSAEGVSTGVEFYPHSPAIVVVDTEIIAQAPERYLVAGIGDAMATWYEARVCALNPAGITAVGARPAIAAAAIGEACCRTLFEHAVAAASAVAAGTVDDSLEAVVEANTLLSGLGFESGGVAAAHGVAQSYTRLPGVAANYLHGEMVAMGTLAQLMMEARPDEAARVARLFAAVGLPVHLGQLGLDAADHGAIETVVEGTLAFPFIGNMPEPVSAEMVRSAILDAHALGQSVVEESGDSSYRRIHNH